MLTERLEASTTSLDNSWVSSFSPLASILLNAVPMRHLLALALLALAPSLAEPSVDPVSVPSARAILALVQAADRFTADPSAPAEVRDAMRTVRHLLVLRDEVAGRRRGSVTP